MIPDEQLQEAFRKSFGWIGKKFVNMKEEAFKKLAPEVQKDVVTLRNWWNDNSFIPGGIEMASKRYPNLKENKIIQTHWGENQWQHSMGSGDQKKIQESLVDGTLDGITHYKRFMAEGDFVNAGIQLGTILHFLEDSWTPGHTARDEQGNILHFFDYAKQSPELHAHEDGVPHDAPSVKNATANAIRLIRLISRDLSEQELRSALENEFYNISLYDPTHENPYLPRASKWDALSVMLKYLGKLQSIRK